jgi:hypothetical protein
MQRHKDHGYGTLVQEEMMRAIGDNILQIIAGLSPISRLRVLAFLHLLERPEALRTWLEVDPSGDLRLTLATANPSPQGPRH